MLFFIWFFQWEAFTYPELANFLRILDREEEEYKNVVRQKYKYLAHKIQEAIDQIKPITTTETEKREEQDESEVPWLCCYVVMQFEIIPVTVETSFFSVPYINSVFPVINFSHFAISFIYIWLLNL